MKRSWREVEGVYEYLTGAGIVRYVISFLSAGRLELAFRGLGLGGRWRIAREFAVSKYLKDRRK
jgi:hypothetical protein